MLAGAVGESETSAGSLQSDCLEAALLSDAYSTRRMLNEVNSMPWVLAQGDIELNMHKLAELPEPPAEVTTAKICKLLNTSNLQHVVMAVALVRDIRWSTCTVDQLHYYSKTVRVLHTIYGTETLVCRGLSPPGKGVVREWCHRETAQADTRPDCIDGSASATQVHRRTHNRRGLRK